MKLSELKSALAEIDKYVGESDPEVIINITEDGITNLAYEPSAVLLEFSHDEANKPKYVRLYAYKEIGEENDESI